MGSTPSKLLDRHRALVIDASVLINLLGTGEIEAIFEAVERPVYLARPALSEVTRDPLTGQSPAPVLELLATRGFVICRDMDSQTRAHMVALTGAPGSDALDDGEAATIAVGASMNCAVVIDEARGRRIAANTHVAEDILGTLDIIASTRIFGILGEDRVRAAILSACRHARMRVPHEWRAWIVDTIGEHAARQLPTLNAYFRGRR